MANKAANKKKGEDKNSKLTELEDKSQITLIKEERTLSSILSKRIINKDIENEEKIRKKKIELIGVYLERYKHECEVFMSHGFVLEPKVMSRCCSILDEARTCEHYDKVTLTTLKTIIRSIVRDTFHLIYIYSNVQSALRSLASELHDASIEYDYDMIVRKAYIEVFDEMRLQQKKGGIKYG